MIILEERGGGRGRRGRRPGRCRTSSRTTRSRSVAAAAAPDAQTILYPGVDHEFTTRAQVDRDAFLRSELDLG